MYYQLGCFGEQKIPCLFLELNHGSSVVQPKAYLLYPVLYTLNVIILCKFVLFSVCMCCIYICVSGSLQAFRLCVSISIYASTHVWMPICTYICVCVSIICIRIYYLCFMHMHACSFVRCVYFFQ